MDKCFSPRHHCSIQSPSTDNKVWVLTYFKNCLAESIYRGPHVVCLQQTSEQCGFSQWAWFKFPKVASGDLAPAPEPESSSSLLLVPEVCFLLFLSLCPFPGSPRGKHFEETTFTACKMPLFTASAVTDRIQRGIEYSQMRYREVLWKLCGIIRNYIWTYNLYDKLYSLMKCTPASSTLVSYSSLFNFHSIFWEAKTFLNMIVDK